MTSKVALEYLFHHVFLPPKLPNKEEDDRAENDIVLMQVCQEELENFHDCLPLSQKLPFKRMIEMVKNIVTDGNTTTTPFSNVVNSLKTMETEDVYAIHVEKQNAGIIIRRRPTEYYFETFELSPRNEDLMSTVGRLRRYFPGPAVAIHQDRVNESSFQKALLQCVEELSRETPNIVHSKSRKANVSDIETRDTIDPALITSMLMECLHAVGRRLDANRIQKRTRDVVQWKDCFHPWRRSPRWLFLRVSLQIGLTETKSSEQSHILYKSFMLFFMCQLLKRSMQFSMSREVLFIMSMKIQRRLFKLDSSIDSELQSQVQHVLSSVACHLKKMIPQLSSPMYSELTVLATEKDTELSMQCLKPYIAGLATRHQSKSKYVPVEPKCRPRIDQSGINLPTLPTDSYNSFNAQSTGEEFLLALADTELWVKDHLACWLNKHQASESSCMALANLISTYQEASGNLYGGFAKDQSVRILTLLDLWVALDKCAIFQEPLLKEYDSGFTARSFSPLLLPTKSEMIRLSSIEQYISNRKAASLDKSPCIFSTINTSESFSVRYFDQSARHQSLRERIISDAVIQRERKKSELETKLKKFEAWKEKDQLSVCKKETVIRGRGRNRREEIIHPSHSCLKCIDRTRAQGVTIDVHEWPLPIDDIKAKSIVFELDVPKVISAWRDRTYSLLVDVFSPASELKAGLTTCYNFSNTALEDYVQNSLGRIRLGSSTKPFVAAHYKQKIIPVATEENILKPSGLNYSVVDSHGAQQIKISTDFLEHVDIQGLCTLKFSGSNKLKDFFKNTEKTSNRALARQTDCPAEMTSHEYYQFASLRAGHLLQWKNILREMEERVLDLSREESFQLMAQAAWQTGPAGYMLECRESHRDLDDETFGIRILKALNTVVSSVESNWQGAGAVRIATMLTTRLLTVSSHDKVHEGCLQLLLRIRLITIAWTRDLVSKLHDCQDESKLEMLKLRCLELALTCHGTFDVETHHLVVILSSVETQAIFIESSITVHDRRPSFINNLCDMTQYCLRLFDRIAHRVEPILRSIIVKEAAGINMTIGNLWSDYSPGNPWTALDIPNSRWLRTKIKNCNGQESLFVDFNILSGELLINGSPLARLPRDYETHATYRRIFGEKMLDVIPSTMPDMAFQTRKSICGQQIHFDLMCDELIIRTRKGDDCFEVIPKRALKDDFTHSFIENYIFMRNDKTGVIQLRPVETPWTFPDNGWKITFSSSKQCFSLTNGLMTVVDIRSQKARDIWQRLHSLEKLSRIDITLNRDESKLEVRLPRFNLDFHGTLETTSLISKQFRGLSVDRDQNLGTFTGLINKLVLCNNDNTTRVVIVPDGDISFKPHESHVKVEISPPSTDCCAYHDYRIDTQLGRLVDNGSLRTCLFRLYLHALTSDVLPDPLTGKTGTEEALQGLSSASVLSFCTLSAGEIELLLKFRNLSPRLAYYPAHKKSMQTISWTKLPTLSQHEQFSTKVERIFTHARSLLPFQDKLNKKQKIPDSDSRGDVNLIHAAAIRNAVCRIDGFGAEQFTSNKDKEYDSRDGNCDANRRAKIYETAALVCSWPQDLNVRNDLLSFMTSFAMDISGPGVFTESVVGYDSRWLNAPKSFLPQYWFPIYQELSASVENLDKYKIMIFLSTMVFSDKVDQALVHTFLAFATHPIFRKINTPQYRFFGLHDGFEPDKSALKSLICGAVYDYNKTPASKLTKLKGETDWELVSRREQAHIDCTESALQTVVESLVSQWPTDTPIASADTNCRQYVHIESATDKVKPSFAAWFRNNEFKKYILRVQAGLHKVPPIKCVTTQLWLNYAKPTSEYVPKSTYIALTDLLQTLAPSFDDDIKSFQFGSFITTNPKSSNNDDDNGKVSDLLLELSQHASGNFEAQYGSHFQQSLDALHNKPSFKLDSSASTYDFAACLEESRTMVRVMYSKILEQLVSSICVFGAMENTTMLPRLSQTTLLSLIANSNPIKLSQQWKRAIVCFGLAVTTLQRLERLVVCSSNKAELLMELSNPGHQGWDPFSFPDWLLLELENGILIRKDQADISKEMINPSSGANSVMQLNMGLGKSSVIVPIVASALADKTKLCRVVVLRALSKQMMELLVKKLGSMINRRIFFLPISRALQMNVEEANQLRGIYETCMRSGGILLVQPEHLLSFELMGLDMVLSGDKDADVGRVINDTQAWLHRNSRDILDESDEILNVRFELIYTVGKQEPIDFAPDRWVLVQRVLTIINSVVQDFVQQYQDDFEIEKLPVKGSFARVRVLRSAVGDLLLENVARYICDQGLPGSSFFRFTKTERDLLYQFITNPSISEKEISDLQQSALATESMKNSLLLLRGLFAHGVLHFAFSQKRWRVNFGLDLQRSSLSVPYHDKDVPAARSEFSHPETTIILTCLSFYYEGLSESQAMSCFKELLKSDNSQGEYDKWTRNRPDIEPKFKQLSGVNLSDLKQWSEKVYTNLKRSKEMIDFYLSHLVFPKEMKEFPKKLSSSGWDIARTKYYPLTGFSGTNDSKYVLPLSIKQQDLEEQLSTNAEVLACLLRRENTFDSTVTGEEFSAKVLINLAVTSKPTVRVILDVGAQVLELRNEEVASEWLSQLPNAEVQAAIFFDSSDELCVLNRDGMTEPLTISPFAKQMDRCVIYLDEAHTRGTDLKLPDDYRAIVTLGPDLTKDRLAQACMRMRKLGKGQSVVLCAPKEIQRKILECTDKSHSSQIEVKHVLLWCIQNTLTHIRKCVLPWAVQGKRHYERLGTLDANPGIISESVLEPEAQTLQERYGLGKEKLDGAWWANPTPTTDVRYSTELSAIRDKCAEFGFNSFAGASLHEEQERELQPEKEKEVQRELFPSVPALKHSLHPDVKRLVTTGIMDPNKSAWGGFSPAFALFQNTSARKYFAISNWPKGLWMTKDYAQTVSMGKLDVIDSFLRPVHWIVTSKQKNETCCVVFSPFEVNELLPSIMEHKKVTLHIYSPRLSLSLRTFENLDVYTIPPLPQSWTIPPTIMQLNLFAGQLYLRSYDEYIRLCQFLGLCHYPPNDDIKIACDNFVPVSSRASFDPVMKEVCPFEQSPVEFLQKVFALRRKGQSFADTHMGRILNGELLTRKDFDGDEDGNEGSLSEEGDLVMEAMAGI